MSEKESGRRMGQKEPEREPREEREERIDEKKPGRGSWWSWFWLTIVILFVIFAAMQYFASKSMDLGTDTGRRNYLQEMRTQLEDEFPELLKYIDDLSRQSKERIRAAIDEEIANAYEPVYTLGIDAFVKFHYSVLGEYAELYNAALDGIDDEKKDRIERLLYEHLFASTGFERNLKESLQRIDHFALQEISKEIDGLYGKIKRDLNTSDAQTEFLVQELFQAGTEEMKERFRSSIGNSLRLAGVGGTAMGGALLSKKMAKLFAKKALGKAMVKGGTKVGGTVAGAAVGAESGLLCGPGAILCSPVGAVIGGIVGWFATDAVAVTVDQYFNEEEFRSMLKRIVERQEKRMRDRLFQVYAGSIDEISTRNKERLESFKHRRNGEILTQVEP